MREVITWDESLTKPCKKVSVEEGEKIATELLEFSKKGLKSKGTLVMKVFMGLGFEEFNKELKKMFNKTTFFKPKSSKSESVETYLIASTIRL